MSPIIGAVVSSGLATLIECQTVYGLEDVYKMNEVTMVDAHNQNLLRKKDANQ